jgi:hypothetical protein
MIRPCSEMLSTTKETRFLYPDEYNVSEDGEQQWTKKAYARRKIIMIMNEQVSILFLQTRNKGKIKWKSVIC